MLLQHQPEMGHRTGISPLAFLGFVGIGGFGKVGICGSFSLSTSRMLFHESCDCALELLVLPLDSRQCLLELGSPSIPFLMGPKPPPALRQELGCSSEDAVAGGIVYYGGAGRLALLMFLWPWAEIVQIALFWATGSSELCLWLEVILTI